MRVLFLFLISITSIFKISAQIPEPSKEEVEKYSGVLKELPPIGSPTPSTMRKLDSVYRTDSNSLLLKGMLGEMNMRLIYDSSRFDRIPQTISIINSLSQFMPGNEDKQVFYHTLGGLYSRLGEFQTSLTYYTKTLELELDSTDKMSSLTGIASVYLNMKKNKKALETIRKMEPPSNWDFHLPLFAEVYFKNNLIDSATLFVNEALLKDTVSYSPNFIKAKILIKKGKKKEACPFINKALGVFSKNNFEQNLNLQSKSNPFVDIIINDLNELEHLKEKYCN